MESSIFRDLDGIVDSILSPYHTLEEVLPSGCDAGPVWMDFDCWVDSQKVDMRTSESPLLLNICGIPASGKSYWAVKWLSENGPCLHMQYPYLFCLCFGNFHSCTWVECKNPVMHCIFEHSIENIIKFISIAVLCKARHNPRKHFRSFSTKKRYKDK